MAAIVDHAVCLRQWDWSETSQTVSLLTREHGVVRGLAKGSRRQPGRFGGGIESATRGEVVFHPKPAHTLATIAGWDVLETFPAARSSVVGFAGATLMIEATQRGISESDPHPAVYDALVEAMRTADRGSASVAEYLWRLLVDTGHKPELDRDVATGDSAPRGRTIGFDPSLGGVTTDPGAGVSSGVWRVRGETLEYLRGLERAGPLKSPMGRGDEVSDRAARLLARYVETQWGVGLVSLPAFWSTSEKAAEVADGPDR
ncbi:MAG: DNA repair protein RecO [Phycisphaerales bacterium]|nr:MAG: DNA repair protein RecO [Phycisphaerales bacterium]